MSIVASCRPWNRELDVLASNYSHLHVENIVYCLLCFCVFCPARASGCAVDAVFDCLASVELHIVTSHYSYSHVENVCYINSCVCAFAVLLVHLAVLLMRPLIAEFLSFWERIVDRE